MAGLRGAGAFVAKVERDRTVCAARTQADRPATFGHPESSIPNTPRPMRPLILVGLLVFLFTAITVQALHPGYDWVHAPLSFYLSGPHGLWLQLAYVALALAIALQSVRIWLRERRALADTLALLLFCAGAVGLVVTALYPGGSPAGAVPPFEHRLHLLSALSAFGLTGLAMLLRGALDWRAGRRVLLPLAMLAFVCLLLHVGIRELPRGASQKAVIALYLLWLCIHSWRIDAVGRVGREPH